MNIALVDDVTEHLKLTQNMTEAYLKERKIAGDLSCFDNAKQLLEHVQKDDYCPDIAILDIQMEEIDGIELARKLNEVIPACRIIFLTSYVAYASDVYETQHIWFVLKKDAKDYFNRAMDKAISSLEEKQKSSLILKQGAKTILIPVNQILYLTKVGRKAQIFCTDGVYYDPHRPAELINEELKGHFLHCHQGFWVNLDMVKELDHDEFILKGDVKVPISRSMRQIARTAFFARYHIS